MAILKNKKQTVQTIQTTTEPKVVKETVTVTTTTKKRVCGAKKPATTATTKKTTTKKAQSNIYYVSPHGDKGWKLIKQNGTKPLFVFTTKAEALTKAKEFGKSSKASIIVKGKDGKMMESFNYKD